MFITNGTKAGSRRHAVAETLSFVLAYERTVSLLRNCHNRVAVAEHLSRVEEEVFDLIREISDFSQFNPYDSGCELKFKLN